MKALITTTINVPTVLRDYRAGMNDDDVIIVAGDLKSPHTQIRDLLASLPGDNRYLSPDDQLNKYEVSRQIGWNCIQRRNIALLEAIRSGAETITTIDDDNIPFPSYFSDVAHHLDPSTVHAVFGNRVGWYNPGKHCIPNVVHRGYPYSHRHDRGVKTQLNAQTIKVGVVAGLWYGDPDIDATERLVNAPNVREMDTYAHGGFALEHGTWAPFNTQNTTFVRDLAPAIFCPPGIGRFDDIWASYVARAVMDYFGFFVAYGKPFVNQLRNEHDLLVDLSAELLGYKYTDRITDALRSVDFTGIHDVVDAVQQCYATLCHPSVGVLPTQTINAMHAWIDDVRKVF